MPDALRSLLLLAAIGYNGASAQADPCLPGEHAELDDYRRSAGYKMLSSEPALCDANMKPGWYRFTSKAGGAMPETCAKRFQCGTLVPVWLQGRHPSVAEGIVTRTGCAEFGHGPQTTPCCDTTIPLGIKNCNGRFFVYYLNPPQTCAVSYCAGDKSPCPAGKGSVTGLTPCSDVYPILTHDPVLSDPVVRGHTFHFACDLNRLPHLPHLKFEVAWTFDGVSDPKINNVTFDETTRTQAVLEGSNLQGHMGKLVGCRVRAWYDNSVVLRKSPWRTSNSYWAGIKVGQGRVTVDEKGGTTNVTLTSTIPFVCDHNNAHACCASLLVRVDGRNIQNQVASAHGCDFKLCQSDWDPVSHTATRNVSLSATKDGIRDGDRHGVVAFETIRTVGGGAYLDAFDGYIVPSVPITAKDTNMETCVWSADPHYTTFNNHFSMYNGGDFTAYENKADHFELQTRTTKCVTAHPTAACQCGLAIREENDVIIINNCANPLKAPYISINPWTGKTLREGTSVNSSTDGRHISVFLTSGRRVTVDVGSYYQNVNFKVPAGDGGEGMCGTLDKAPRYDYMHRNHTIEHNVHASLPVGFTESWRVNRSTSLFTSPPPAMAAPKDDPMFCKCDASIPGAERLNCSKDTISCGHPPCVPTPAKPGCFFAFCKNPVFTSHGRRSAGDLYLDVDEADPPVVFTSQSASDSNPTWPTPSGITEAQAEARCRRDLVGTQVYQLCRGMTARLDFLMADCLADVQLGDSYDMTEGSVEAFMTSCLLELKEDLASYTTDAQGTLVLKESIAQVCSLSCLKHGACVHGKCVCNAGYTGDYCQLVAGQGPQLKRVRGPSECDINERPCRTIFFEADNFQMGDTFKCKVQTLLPNGHASTEVLETAAHFIAGDRLACSFPDARLKTDRSVKTFAVSVTSDGHRYGTAIHVTVFDSSCQSCDSKGCTQKPKTCLIDDLCHQDGDYKPHDVTKVCNAAASATAWSNSQHATVHTPALDVPTLTGPDDDFQYLCTLHSSSHEASARFRVTWLVDGHVISAETLAADQREAFVGTSHLPGSGKLLCRVQSFYVGKTDMSPAKDSPVIVLH